MSALPVDTLNTAVAQLNLGTAKVHHLPDWNNLSHPQRLAVLRKIAMARGRDPRIARVAVQIFRDAKVLPREYKKQAAALLAWVQNPKNVFYVNEPGERLQDPIYTLQQKSGDCFAENTLILRQDMELIPIQDVKIGDRIWGKDRWSEVVNFWDKGVLPVTEIILNNGATLRLTEGHKVYVMACCGPEGKNHGPGCATKSTWSQCAQRYGLKEVRIDVKDLLPGMHMLQPETIEQPETPSRDSEDSWLRGAFVAEGWAEDYRIMLSAQDGHWKEETKHRAKALAEKKGWGTRWDHKYLAINSREAVAFCSDCGKGALNKRIPTEELASGHLSSLDDGLRLDAAKNTKGEGWTLGTVSATLTTQYRVLQRMLGRSTSVRKVEAHGGFGKNPIYRIGVRNPTKNNKLRLLVREIRRDVESVSCYDIATDDHYVYLPEADCTVSNCDDQILLLTCLFESIGLPWRLVLSGRGPQGKVRYIEGTQLVPEAKWTHVYCMVGVPPYNPTEWYFCEPTLIGVPLGWDVISGDKRFLPEMEGRKGPARLRFPVYAGKKPKKVKVTSGTVSPAYEEAMGDAGSYVSGALAQEVSQERLIDWPKIAQAVVTGVCVSVGTSLFLSWLEGRGVWEGQGTVVERWRRVTAPLDNSMLVTGSTSHLLDEAEQPTFGDYSEEEDDDAFSRQA